MALTDKKETLCREYIMNSLINIYLQTDKNQGNLWKNRTGASFSNVLTRQLISSDPITGSHTPG